MGVLGLLAFSFLFFGRETEGFATTNHQPVPLTHNYQKQKNITHFLVASKRHSSKPKKYKPKIPTKNFPPKTEKKEKTAEKLPAVSSSLKRFKARKAIRRKHDYALYKKAKKLNARRKFSQARSILQTLLMRYPEDLNISYMLGSVNFSIGDYDRAAISFQRVLNIRQQAHPVRLFLVRTLLASKQDELAAEQINYLYAKRKELSPSLLSILNSYQAFLENRMREKLKAQQRPIFSGLLQTGMSTTDNDLLVSKDSPVFTDVPQKATKGNALVSLQLFVPLGLSPFALEFGLSYQDKPYLSKKKENASIDTLYVEPSFTILYGTKKTLTNMHFSFRHHVENRKTSDPNSSNTKTISVDHTYKITSRTSFTLGGSFSSEKAITGEDKPLNTFSGHVAYSFNAKSWSVFFEVGTGKAKRKDTEFDYDGYRNRMFLSSLSYSITKAVRLSTDFYFSRREMTNNISDEFFPPPEYQGEKDIRHIRGLSVEKLTTVFLS